MKVLIAFGICLLWGTTGLASTKHSLTADELLLICNTRHPYSKKLAEYYARMRNVPAENPVSVAVEAGESCSRATYNQAIRLQVQQKLAVLSTHKTILTGKAYFDARWSKVAETGADATSANPYQRCDHTMAECYMLSLPFLSWQMVLIGDPLYRPFKKNQLTSR